MVEQANEPGLHGHAGTRDRIADEAGIAFELMVAHEVSAGVINLQSWICQNRPPEVHPVDGNAEEHQPQERLAESVNRARVRNHGPIKGKGLARNRQPPSMAAWA